ncbi:MAG: hypothetical protein COB02_17775 [Candidatus Cloacimonadota bacterium]|nr:MAG: hypothetical protein COB02_17775 [Candidatus Cloacimonadota bacterium]
MNVLLIINLPNNWTNQESQILKPLFKDGTSLLQYQIDKLFKMDATLHASLQIDKETDLTDKCIHILKKNNVSYKQYNAPTLEAQKIVDAFESNSEWKNLLKVVVEDFFSPSDYAIEIYKDIKDDDYTFSIFETAGLNFEIFSRSIIPKLLELDTSDKAILQYQIARTQMSSFKRKRYRRKYINEFEPNFRFTLDSNMSYKKLQSYLLKNDLNEENLKSFSIKENVFLRTFPNQFYNHREDYDGVFDSGSRLQFLERGLICKRHIFRDDRVLDICSGDMLLPELVYTKASKNITCVDNSQTSKEVFEKNQLAKKGIRLLDHSILEVDGWDKIRKDGSYDVVTFTAGIEHFIEEDQHFLAKQISMSLKEGGYLVGDTCMWRPNCVPGHWQHKNEFYSEEQLALIFKPYFSEVEVFLSDYCDMPDLPLYFVCKK